MCGINFIVDKKGALDDRPINSMVESISHRGQDFQSVYKHNSGFTKYFFGANRLKIINKDDNSNQPFFDNDKSVLLLFNGEIYNYFDLKNELISLGYQFRTNSDTEVLCYWLKEFGTIRLNDLEGMYAFVFFDLISEEFICARDRFGIKPLYYFENENFLILSSEIKAIINSNIIEKKLNEEVVSHYLLYRYANAPETFYKDVFHFLPGYFSKSSQDKRLKFRKVEEEIFDHEQPALESFKEAIKDSLLKQIYATAGAGIMLSGGIDSSLIMSLANEEGVNLPAFSIFAAGAKEERKIASAHAAKYFIHHEIFEVDHSSLYRFDEYISKLDQPIADSAGLLTYLLAEKVSPQIKVLLSGAGADELFAGYNRHYAFYKYLKHPKKLLFLKKIFKSLNGSVSGSAVFKVINNIDKDPVQTFLNFSSSHFSVFKGRAGGKKIQMAYRDPLRWALEYDRNNYLPNDVLSVSDIVTMSCGVEMRLPFLDNKLVNLVRRTDPQFLISKGKKWILKEILSEYTSRKHINFPKTGFGLPLKDWLRQKEHKHLWDLFQNENSIIFKFLDYNFVRQLIDTHQNQKQDHSQALWSLLTLGHWLNKEFES